MNKIERECVHIYIYIYDCTLMTIPYVMYLTICSKILKRYCTIMGHEQVIYNYLRVIKYTQ